MKNFIKVVSLAAIAILVISCVTNNSAKLNNNVMQQEENEETVAGFAPIAVIELFTSQGCSSCPPADELLTKTVQTDKSNNIYALSFHVDYWDRLGWKDPFSDSRFSQRQYDYVKQLQLNSAYTPQMVVNGQKEFVGSNKNSLQSALTQALKTSASAGFTKLTASKKENEWIVKYEIDGDVIGKQLNVALVSEQEITKIKRGENSGRTLQTNNVVTTFATADPISSGEITIAQYTATKSKQAIIVYLQDKASLKIVGAAKLDL